MQYLGQLLPAGQKIGSCEHVASGLTNIAVKCTTTSGNVYIFRYAQHPGANHHFYQSYTVAHKAAQLHCAPRIIAVDNVHKCMLMEYIDSAPWPLYENNPQPYKATMKMLRQFHDNMRLITNTIPGSKLYAPFSAIRGKEKQLLSNPLMPHQLKKAFDIIRTYIKRSEGWLEKNGTTYHGDLKNKNVVLERREGELHPLLIDFDYSAMGHPYFDVVKFSQKLEHVQRMELFNVYLGKVPTTVEKEQFLLMDNTLRMLIALIRFQDFLRAHENNPSAPVLTKKEMEDLLDSSAPLPSQATILISDPNPKQQQLAAVYALHEFLRGNLF